MTFQVTIKNGLMKYALCPLSSHASDISMCPMPSYTPYTSFLLYLYALRSPCTPYSVHLSMPTIPHFENPYFSCTPIPSPLPVDAPLPSMPSYAYNPIPSVPLIPSPPPPLSRCVQKRLLIRFKEKNPSPVSHLDLLLEGTYEELLALGSSYEELQAPRACRVTWGVCLGDVQLACFFYVFVGVFLT